MHNLHPGARWLLRLNAYSRFSIIAFILIYFMISFLFDSETYNMWRKTSILIFGNSFLGGLLVFLFICIIFVLIVGEIYARMAYNRFLYEIGHDNVKIEHGIIWKKYTSIPFERVQNVDIKRGIIARIFGFSTLEIETAGQSGIAGYYGRGGRRAYHSEGHLPAIDIGDAEKIREFIMKKIKHSSEGL